MELKPKQFSFLCSLPRAGNTLLSSIVNQNSNIQISPNSILPDALYELNKLKDTKVFKRFPDHKSYDNIIKNVFNNYYYNNKAEYIIDRSCWGTPDNLLTIENIFGDKAKFIILTRPILEVIASYKKIYQENNLDFDIDQHMSLDGIIGKNLWSIQNIIKSNKNHIVINYLDLINNPTKEVKRIYKFLNIDTKDIKIEKLTLYKFNNLEYEDEDIKNLHKIKTDKIYASSNYDYKKYLNSYIINKYSNLSYNA